MPLTPALEIQGIMTKCVCGSALEFDACCGPILAGASAPTAEALMRSRYAAYVVGNLAHLEATDTPEARDEFNPLDAERIVEETEWLGLEILRVAGGGSEDSDGQVEFTFRYRRHGKLYAQHERAYFCRDNGYWLYQRSEIDPKSPPLRVSERIGRNDPCPCGSGRKYKKCCGGTQ